MRDFFLAVSAVENSLAPSQNASLQPNASLSEYLTTLKDGFDQAADIYSHLSSLDAPVDPSIISRFEDTVTTAESKRPADERAPDLFGPRKFESQHHWNDQQWTDRISGTQIIVTMQSINKSATYNADLSDLSLEDTRPVLVRGTVADFSDAPYRDDGRIPLPVVTMVYVGPDYYNLTLHCLTSSPGCSKHQAGSVSDTYSYISIPFDTQEQAEDFLSRLKKRVK